MKINTKIDLKNAFIGGIVGAIVLTVIQMLGLAGLSSVTFGASPLYQTELVYGFIVGFFVSIFMEILSVRS